MSKISELISKYKTLSVPIKASMAYMACNIIQKCILTFTTPAFTRLMSTEQYGEVTLFNSWLYIVTIFASLKVAAGGFNSGMERFGSNREEYISSLQGLATSCALIELVLFPFFFYKFAGGINSDNYFVPLLFVYVMFSTPVDLWMGLERYNYKYRRSIAMTLFITIFNPLLGILMVSQADNKGMARVLSIVVVQVLAGVVAIVINQKRGKKYYNKQYWLFIMKINIPLIPHYLAQIVLSQSDRIMIERMCGKTEVAIYGVAYTLGMIMLFVSDAVSASYLPWLYRKFGKAEYNNIKKITNLIVAFVGVVLLTPVLFAPELMYILGGKKYADGIWIVPSVALGAFFIFVYGLFANVQFYYGESKRTTIGSCVAAGINFGLNLVCIKLFGYIAAGYTTAISYFVLVVFHYFFMKNVLKENHVKEKIFDERFIFLFCLFEVGVCGIALVSYINIILRCGLIIALALVFYINRDRFLQLFKLKNSDVEDKSEHII